MSSSDFLTQAQMAALHRETYINILKGLLPWGTAKNFAQRLVGITPVYLSNLLDPNHNPPSPELAERIVHALPVDSDERLRLLEHMLLAREEQERGNFLIGDLARQDIQEGHHALRRAYDTVLASRIGEKLSPLVIGLRESGKAFISSVDPRRAGLVFVESCLIIHYAQTLLNRWEDALYVVLLGDAVLQSLDPTDTDIDSDWFRHLRINMLHAKALTLRNVNLMREAMQYVNQALEMTERSTKAHRAIWLPAIYREKIEILARLPRFALSEIEGLGDQVRAIYDAQLAENGALTLLLVDRALINAWTNYGSNRSLKRAGIKLRTRLEELDTISGLGPLHKTMFLRSASRYYWRQRQYDEWRYFTKLLLHTASTADLKHQLSVVRREFGSQLNTLEP